MSDYQIPLYHKYPEAGSIGLSLVQGYVTMGGPSGQIEMSYRAALEVGQKLVYLGLKGLKEKEEAEE